MQAQVALVVPSGPHSESIVLSFAFLVFSEDVPPEVILVRGRKRHRMPY